MKSERRGHQEAVDAGLKRAGEPVSSKKSKVQKASDAVIETAWVASESQKAYEAALEDFRLAKNAVTDAVEHARKMSLAVKEAKEAKKR